jgi:hypothetical protein
MEEFIISVTEQSVPIAVTILHLAGRLDHASETLLRERAGQLHESGTRRLLLDLEQVTYIASAGLRAIHLIYKMYTPAEEMQAWQPGGDVYKSPYFKLSCPSPEVYGVLNLAGFLHNILFFNNLNDALLSFK